MTAAMPLLGLRVAVGKYLRGSQHIESKGVLYVSQEAFDAMKDGVTVPPKSTERAMLDAIAASPNEDTPRLVLADYYDEHARPDQACEQRLAVCLRAVKATPADDEPRLAYAKVCDDYGRHERAEFIRDCVTVLAKHTDCPIRLADLGRGRPVPLRCGVCDYCKTRQRAERFYAKHSWHTSPYAVCLEPTPIDGGIPLGSGITFVVTRGFVGSVWCSWEVWADDGDTITAAHPVTRVTLTTVHNEHPTRHPYHPAWEFRIARHNVEVWDDEVKKAARPDVTVGITIQHLALAKRWPGITFELPT